MTSTAIGRLHELSALLVSGPDARTYLQGQLSFDMTRLSAQRLEVACCNSAQGRVQAVLWMVERREGLVLLSPTSMLETTLLRLKKYVLRAKVKLELANLGVFQGNPDPTLPARSHRETAGISSIAWPDHSQRVVLLAAPEHFGELPAADIHWHRADIHSGLPRIYPQTYEAFVAQMLNLDLLGGISFEKGCYTGQEIIARTHFRGTVKRRMLGFRAATAPPLPSTRIVSGEQHAGDVVDAIETPDGCELLAVINLTQRAAPLQLESGASLESMTFPYSIPQS